MYFQHSTGFFHIILDLELVETKGANSTGTEGRPYHMQTD